MKTIKSRNSLGSTDETVDLLQNVFSGFENIDKAVLYGSRAKGNFRNGTDIDFSFDKNSKKQSKSSPPLITFSSLKHTLYI